jgi:hypothetical protein
MTMVNKVNESEPDVPKTSESQKNTEVKKTQSHYIIKFHVFISPEFKYDLKENSIGIFGNFKEHPASLKLLQLIIDLNFKKFDNPYEIYSDSNNSNLSIELYSFWKLFYTKLKSL